MVCSMIEYCLRVERIVKTFGMVNANPETIKGSECITIINGFSNLMMEVYLFTISLRNIKSPITSEVIPPGVWPREGRGSPERRWSCHVAPQLPS